MDYHGLMPRFFRRILDRDAPIGRQLTGLAWAFGRTRLLVMWLTGGATILLSMIVLLAVPNMGIAPPDRPTGGFPWLMTCCLIASGVGFAGFITGLIGNLAAN